ncbi:glycosyl hydrolase family 8 [Pseudotabrizicola sp. 4114]|uniref:glycosyl hydrolase family 8 n=1 Tax=Pseudotabrizicola sp. 4114 TaxID=2817731 RepID=UPI0028572039|nr:endoglucanase [Pseudorhodobacter sp. 4114]
MNRRRFIRSLGVALSGLALPQGAWAQQPRSIAGAIPPGHALQASWQAWKTLCLRPDGRVIDGFQNEDSHSEGQSYGLTLAAAFDDEAAFESIRIWTEENLAIRDDALLAWRWRHDQRPHVPDDNNASDGDLFYAWALSAMAARHDRPELAQRARMIAQDLVSVCSVPHPNGSGSLLFLPAQQGFAADTGFTINPSYYMPRAMRELAAATGVSQLQRLADDGVALMTDLAESGLVPDWVTITADGWVPPPERFSFNAGYEAMRVPLFAVWSGNPEQPSARRYAAAAQTNPPDETTTVFERGSGASLERSPHRGYQAVVGLVSCAVSGSVGAAIPAFATDQPYYPATLHLMALVAQAEIYPQCVPI